LLNRSIAKRYKKDQSPDSVTKIGADDTAMSFYDAFELPITIVSPFKTFGPRQSARAIIPTIIAQIANGMKEIKLGDLTPTRDFNFVKDTLLLIKHIIQSVVNFLTEEQRLRPGDSEVFRLGGDNTVISFLTISSHNFSLFLNFVG